MPHIIVLVGLPACGKSTFIQNGDFQNHEIISSDNLIEDYAKTVNKTYEEVFSEYIKIASRKILKIYDEALKSNKNIIIDRTNLTEKSRNISYRDWETDRKSTRLNSSHSAKSRMPSSA